MIRTDLFGKYCKDRWGDNVEVPGTRLLNEAARRARLVTSDLYITAHLHRATAVTAALPEGDPDELIVLGQDRNLGRSGRVARSLNKQIIRRSGSPVAIVELFGQGPRGRSAGRVVVGFDRTGDPVSALRFAFRAADRRGVGVSVVEVPTRGSARYDDRAGDALSACREVFQDVDVRERFVAGPIGRALVAESPGAALVVLASSAHGRLRVGPSFCTWISW